MSDAEKRMAAENEAEMLELLDDSAHYIEVLKCLQNDMDTLNASGIRCAAHTLQLAIKFALKSGKAKILISMCRIASKLQRKSTQFAEYATAYSFFTMRNLKNDPLYFLLHNLIIFHHLLLIY